MAEAGDGWEQLKWVVESGKWLFEQRKWIRGFLGIGRDGDTDSNRDVLILGPGGVGKTTLGRFLSGEDLPYGQYQESIDVERYDIEGSSGVEVVVPPGQEARRAATWTNLLQDVVAGNIRGIVLVVSNGYNSLGIGYKQTKVYQELEAPTVEEFLAAYTEWRRREEITILKELSDCVKLATAPMWLLTIITKQDLWWPQREDAEEHYRNGPYGRAIDKLVQAKDGASFRHELAFASLRISNFQTKEGELLCTNTAGYDEERQFESVKALFNAFESLRNWEERT